MSLSIESLLSEGKAALAESARSKRIERAKPKTVDDLLSQAIKGEGPERPSPLSWQTVGLRYLLVEQTCLQCSSTEKYSGGLYLEQEHTPTRSRRVVRDAFSEEDMARFEPQIERHLQSIPLCYSCLLVEQLILKASQRQQSLPFTEGLPF